MSRSPAFIPVPKSPVNGSGNNPMQFRTFCTGFQPLKNKVSRLFSRKGFTLAEILIVVAILGLVVSVAFINFISSTNNRALVTSVETLADNVRRAQIFSQQNKNAKNWGVRFINQSQYEIISGNPLVPASITVYKTYELERNIVFNTLNFQVWFLKNTGELDPVNSANLDLGNKIHIQNQQGRQAELEISLTGVIQTKVL